MSSRIDTDERRVVLDILVEFIEVAIHCVLYNRNLYPQGVFEKRNKYNVPVQMCLHPEVNSYISNVIESLNLLLTAGRVDKIAVVVLDEVTAEPVEKFVIEVRELKNKWQEKDPHLLQTERELRAFLLKLNISDALMKPPSSGTTWTIHVDTTEPVFEEIEVQLIEKDFPWIQVEEKQSNVEDAKLVPIRSANSGILKMQLYAEEKQDDMTQTLIGTSDSIMDNSDIIDDTQYSLMDTTYKALSSSGLLHDSPSTSQET